MGNTTSENYIRLRDGGICVYCRDAVGQQLEHVIPASMGGPGIRGNIVLSCASCNLQKAYDLERFLPIAIRHLIAVGESIDWLAQRTERFFEAYARDVEREVIDSIYELDDASDELENALDDLHLLGLECPEAIEALETLGFSTTFALSDGMFGEWREPVIRIWA